MKKEQYDRKTMLLTAGAMIIIVLVVLIWHHMNPLDWTMYDSKGIDYPRGKVVQVVKNDLDRTNTEKGRQLGAQQLKVKITSGQIKGKTVNVDNTVTETHHILCKTGTHVIVKVDHPKGTDPYYTLYNYDRIPAAAIMIAVFAALMVLIGRKKGAGSMIGLAFAVFLILFWMLPALYHGYPPVPTAVLTCTAITVFSMILLNGWSRQTETAVISAAAGIIAASVIYMIFAGAMHLSGYNLEAAEELILIHQGAGMKVSDLLFVSIMISSLGAILDTAVSISSSLWEMSGHSELITRKQLYHSGLEIGNDIAGTNAQILILAFAGSSITTLLVVVSYGFASNQLLNADFVAVEMLQGLVGGIGIILTVPITAFLSSAAICGEAKKSA